MNGGFLLLLGVTFLLLTHYFRSAEIFIYLERNYLKIKKRSYDSLKKENNPGKRFNRKMNE